MLFQYPTIFKVIWIFQGFYRSGYELFFIFTVLLQMASNIFRLKLLKPLPVTGNHQGVLPKLILFRSIVM